MIKLSLVLITFFALLPTFSQAADDSYGYPVPGLYAATILGTPVPTAMFPET